MVANRELAERLMNELRYVPGATDLRIQQPFDNPKFDINVDRTKSEQIGLQQRDVANSLLVATSGSFQTTPTYWLNPANGVSYSIAVQSPQYNLDSLQDLNNIPLTPGSGAGAIGGMAAPSTYQRGGAPVQILGNVSSIVRGQDLGTISHYNIAPAIDIYGNVVNTDLASVDKKLEVIVDKYRKQLPRGSQLIVRGQVLLVYLLIVINFQSWLDPFIIISALPSALAGIVWMLFLTHTHISVPALTGSIMCVGVATANSILVISFARERLEVNVGDAWQSALDAGFTRFRPVVMTALAMIIGMVPMALGLGDGGEQNAPLGRAVIGGLLFATISTLLFVPTFFSVLHGRLEKKRLQTVVARHAEDDE
jgi:multidrug efflux pump subunit AcrB